MDTSNFFRRHSWIVAGIVGSVLFLLFYWNVLVRDQVFFFLDTSRFFYPMWHWGASVLRSGIIPLWNPDAQFGAPYLADPQNACAYPPVFLFFSWFGPLTALTFLVVFHHGWCLIGTWVWARQQGASAFAAFWASLVFGFSAHVVCSTWTPVAHMAISWLPWVFVGAEAVLQKRPWGFCWLAFAWAMQLAAGYPVLVYLTGLTLFAYLLWRSFTSVKRNWGWIWPIGGAALFAFAYNLVWELPFVDVLRHSNYQQTPQKSQDLGWRDLATFLDPFFSGHPAEGKDPGFDYWVGTYFLGLPVLAGLIVGAFKTRRNSFFLWLVLVVLSLGSTSMVGEFLKKILPSYGLVVHSGFWIALVLLFAAVLSGEALEVTGSKDRPWFWTFVGVVVYGAAFWLKKPYFLASFTLSLAFWVVAGWVRWGTGRWALIFLALATSLGPAVWSLNLTVDRTYEENKPAVLARLDRNGRIFFSPVQMEQGVRLSGTTMNEAYEKVKGWVCPNWPLAFGFEEVPVYNTLRSKETTEWTYLPFLYSVERSKAALDFLGLRYVVGPAKFPGLRRSTVEGTEVPVWEDPSAFSPWFAVTEALPAGGTLKGDLDLVARERIDWARTAFVPDPADVGKYQERKVKVEGRTIDSVTLSAVGKGKGLIVSSESEMPGWSVWVEGRERPVLTVNHAFRGVVVQDGESQLVFRYRPVTFQLGLFLTLVTCALWFSLFGVNAIGRMGRI
jgi:hypothetical protein